MTDQETDVEQQAWDSLFSLECPICKTLKKRRQSFCYSCYKKLPSHLQRDLYKTFREGYVVHWLKAMAILKGQVTA